MKTYVISGSSSGIGRAIANALLNAGFNVIGLARDHSKFQPDNPQYKTYSIDFSNLYQLEKQLKFIAKDHPSIDGIICSAGYGQFGELEQFSSLQIQELINVNFTSQAILIKSFLDQLKKKQEGHIIIIGSEAALSGEKKGSIYCASKFALRGFSQSLRKECATANIAVSLINPGFVDTAFFDKLNFRPKQQEQHMLDVDQIAELAQHIIKTPTHCVVEEINLQPLTKVLEKKAT